MRVAELMTIDPITVNAETSVADVANLMEKHRINGLPVLDSSKRLIGVITQGDLLRRPELGTDRRHVSWFTDFFLRSRMADDFVHTHGRHVSEVMTHHPAFVSPDSALREVADIMTRKRFRCLPVLRNSVLVGVISRSDLIRSLATKLPGNAQTSDDDIRRDILASLAREQWVPNTGLRVDVEAGIVTLEGIVFSDSERRALKVVAENTAGVKQINDHLMYVDSNSGFAFPATI